jgi:hypothetical protein
LVEVKPFVRSSGHVLENMADRKVKSLLMQDTGITTCEWVRFCSISSVLFHTQRGSTNRWPNDSSSPPSRSSAVAGGGRRWQVSTPASTTCACSVWPRFARSPGCACPLCVSNSPPQSPLPDLLFRVRCPHLPTVAMAPWSAQPSNRRRLAVLARPLTHIAEEHANAQLLVSLAVLSSLHAVCPSVPAPSIHTTHAWNLVSRAHQHHTTPSPSQFVGSAVRLGGS